MKGKLKYKINTIPNNEKSKPNIIFLLVDTLRLDHLSCYGYKRKTTPFLNEFAKNSVKYTNFYSTSNWSLPAYSSLFTGKYPYQHGAVDWKLKPKGNRLVRELNKKGYYTVAFSSHMVVSPYYNLGQEFDELELITPSHKIFKDRLFDKLLTEYKGEGIGKFLHVIKGAIKNKSPKTLINALHMPFKKIKRDYLGFFEDEGASEIVSKVKDFKKRKKEPFFLFISLLEPHFNYTPPRACRKKFTGASLGEIRKVINKKMLKLSIGIQEIKEDQKELLIDLYDAEINYVDSKIKEIIRSFNKDLIENSLIIITSDHGDSFGERGAWGHRKELLNSLINVPLIINFPWKKEGGSDKLSSLKNLESLIKKVGRGAKTQLKGEERVFAEYYGLSSQHQSTPWEKFNIPKGDLNEYQVACISKEKKFIWKSNGEKTFYTSGEEDRMIGVSEKTPKIFKKYVKSEMGDPKKIKEKYDRKIGLEEDVSEVEI